MNIFNGENSKNKIYGVLFGIVTSIDDPDKKNRVKVKLLTQVKNSYETDFIRVANSFSGNNYGSYFMPEVDDEVIVAFNNGDIESPVVIGCMYNKKKSAPFKIEDSKNTKKAIITKQNNRIIIDDEDDATSISIKTKKDFQIVIDDKEESITVSDKSEKNILKIDSSNGLVEISSEKEIKLKAGGASISLSNGNIEINSDTSIKIASSQVELNGSSTVNVKSSSVLEVKSDGVTNLKGATVKIN